MKTAFGWVEIHGKRYDHDVVIHADGSISKRKKKVSKAFRAEYGHTPLSGGELTFLAEERPEIVYIGTGQYGDLPLTRDAESLLEAFTTVLKPTPEVLPLLGKEKRRYCAVLHVTC